MIEFTYELIHVQEILVYLRFSRSREQVFFVNLTISTSKTYYFTLKTIIFLETRLNLSRSRNFLMVNLLFVIFKYVFNSKKLWLD